MGEREVLPSFFVRRLLSDDFCQTFEVLLSFGSLSEVE